MTLLNTMDRVLYESQRQVSTFCTVSHHPILQQQNCGWIFTTKATSIQNFHFYSIDQWILGECAQHMKLSCNLSNHTQFAIVCTLILMDMISQNVQGAHYKWNNKQQQVLLFYTKVKAH